MIQVIDDPGQMGNPLLGFEALFRDLPSAFLILPRSLRVGRVDSLPVAQLVSVIMTA